MLKNNKKYFPYLIFTPIYLNFFNNILNKNFYSIINKVNYYDLFSVFTLFIFLYQYGKLIKITLNLKTISISIIYLLFSFFVFDTSLLFFYKSLSFNQVFLIVNLIWIAFFIFYKKEYAATIFTVLLYAVNNFMFNSIYNKLTINKNIIGDVDAYFYSQAKTIFENSYYYSINNPITEGYPQFLSYIQALLFRYLNGNVTYEFYAPTSQIIFLLSLLFFLELEISFKNKLIISSLFSILIFNSLWFQFLFTSSLMSEGIVSLFSAIIIYEIFTIKRITFNHLILLGLLYFTKQFFSIICLLLVIYIAINQKSKKFLVFGFSGLVLKELLFKNVFPGKSSSRHLSQIDILDLVGDIILFRDLKLNNILLILKNVFVDKPLTVILFGLIVIYFYKVFSKYHIKKSTNIFYSIISINIVFIFTLYVSAWQNMELESPVRYILSFLHLKLVSIATIVEN